MSDHDVEGRESATPPRPREKLPRKQVRITLSRRDTLALIAALGEVRPIAPALVEDLRDYARLIEQRS